MADFIEKALNNTIVQIGIFITPAILLWHYIPSGLQLELRIQFILDYIIFATLLFLINYIRISKKTKQSK